MRRIALGSAAHLALLVAPFVVAGRLDVFTAPRSIACAALLLALSLLESRAAPRDSGDVGVLGAISGITLLVIGWLAIGSGPTPGTWSWLGAGCGAIGIALRLRAIADLGTDFSSAIEPGQRLVAVGIYARVRHPSEVGLLLLGAGLAGLGGSRGATALAAAVLLPASIVRIAREERALSARFGERYTRYREAVHAVVPVGGRGR
ncbi:MAG: Protein-S-isoprenylcysteine O-methyltransferase [Labilithrix sp.]|nr:Protein-S-isoprenylcysteine O-methyltransferase [Labilithrix sp.]